MIVVLAGPIKWWWDENWDTPEAHWYRAWRHELSNALVRAGHLVYRPHEAFKGSWDEDVVVKDRYRSPQAVNDAAIRICDLVINMTPRGIPSLGTDDEMLVCQNEGKPVIPAPPPNSMEASLFDRAALVAEYVTEIGRLLAD